MTVKDVACPYCKYEQDINHDDGYGYDEFREYEQDCVDCGRTFKFYTSITFSYEVHCDGEHDMEQCIPPHNDLYECSRCDHYEVRRGGG